MNILMITRDLNVLREHSSASAAMEEFSKMTKHLVVISLNTRRDAYPARKVSAGLWIMPTNAPLPLWAPFRAMRIARRELFFQGRLQADVICAEDPGLSGVTAWLLSIFYFRPFQLHLDKNVLSGAYGRQSFGHFLRMCVARYLARRADALHVTSENTLATIAEMSTALADRAILGKPYMNVEAFQQEPVRVNLVAKYPQFKSIVLAVAPLVRASNMDRAIAALAGATKVFPYVGLVIVGEGPLLGQLKKRARKLDVAGHVVFEAPNDNLSSYYKTARIFINTTSVEEYDDCIVKAAAASCAIVTTKVGSAESFIKDGESGYFCEEYDPSHFSDTIVMLIHKPDVCNKIRINANIAVQSYMNSDIAAHLRSYQESWEKAIALSAAPKL